MYLDSPKYYTNQGSQRMPRKHGDFNFICPGPEIAWNFPLKSMKNIDKTRNLAEKTTWIEPGMLRYKIFHFYTETIFLQVLCSYNFRMSLASAFWC